jgi:hypothetical protein
MKFHASMVDKIVYLCTNYGGYIHETKLTELVSKIRVTPYARLQQESKDQIVLVETEALLKERTMRNTPTMDVVPMELHPTVQSKILDLYRAFSGHIHETKLRRALSELDFTPYESKTTGKFCIVLMSDYMNALRGSPSTR